MATARRLSMIFLVAVLVASTCFADAAYGFVLGSTLRKTRLQEQPGTGEFIFVNLAAKTFLHVNCRLQSSAIGLDPWWLNVVVPFSGQTGYVPCRDLMCFGAAVGHHCDNVPHC